MRIHELAKELGIDSKKLIKKLKGLKISVKNHMSSIDAETAAIVKQKLGAIDRKEIEDNVIEVNFPITLKDLSVKVGKKSSEILKYFIKKGKLFNINQSLDEETACSLAYDFRINLKKRLSKEENILKHKTKEKDKKKRTPIVTLMGHIDHGKTSILDYIRKSKIASKETGGITQHIGGYHVDLDGGGITFLDTPGHETFTAMRARGADATDIVIIVIAADEGIKPQTVEAIDHARAAKVPIIAAINKIDRPNANIDMVKQQLSKAELVPEDWGGQTITVGVSAKTGEGIDDLLEMIILQSDMMELKADYLRPAIGVVIEARLSKGKGSLASVLVQEGVLKPGDFAVCGLYWGRIKAIHDDKGNNCSQALPSFPVEVLGLNGVPSPGEQFMVAPDEKTAKEIAEKRREANKKDKLMPKVHLKLEDLYKKVKEEDLKQLKVILKADVGGTLEAVEGALMKIPSNEVELAITHKGVGAVNSSDVLLADVTDSVIVGFKVSIDAQVRELARKKGIELRSYQIVYELIDDVKGALEGLLTPQIKRTFVGRARVKNVFKLSRSGVIAGCVVDKGKIPRSAIFQLFRGTDIILEGKIQTLKRFKDDVKEVANGFECGIGIGSDDLKVGDVIDVFHEETIARKLK